MSVTRLINQGLVLISPVILVRVLTVEDFGRYREFLLYSTVLLSLAAFGINSSLLRFIPHRPEHGWRFINQAVLMTFASSLIVVAGALLANQILGGSLLGEYALQVGLYVLLFVNLDFWEYFWLAQRRPVAVFAYTTGRLFARITVVVTAALLAHDVTAIVWSLVGLEAVRLTASFIGWRSRRESMPPLEGSWREQLKFCLPFGGSQVLVTLNRSMGNLFVAKLLGPVGLAHYAIGTYVQPVITVLRNSLSDVLLPEMVGGSGNAQGRDALHIWRRTTVVIAIFLFAAGVVLAKFAEVLIPLLFSARYRAAVLIFQIYLLVLIRETIDFSVLLRAANHTAPILRSNLIAIAANVALLLVLLPAFGLVGAVTAFVVSRMIEGFYLGRQTVRAYHISWRVLCNWGDLAKVAGAAAAAALVLYGSFWTDWLGIFGVVAGGLVYLVTFVALLCVLRIPEVYALARRLKDVPHALQVARRNQ